MLRSMCAASALALCGTLGSADTLHLSYDLLGTGAAAPGFTGATITGFFEGTETSPGVFEISDAYGLTKDGTPLGETVEITGAETDFFGNPITPAVISLDKSFLDFVSCFDDLCRHVFAIVNNVDYLIDPSAELALYGLDDYSTGAVVVQEYDRPINYAGLNITRSMDYMFEYTTGTTGQVFSGLFEGVVDAGDPNRLFVLSGFDLKLDGADIGPAESIISLGSDIPGVLTFDQSAFDTSFCFDALCSTGFGFNSTTGNFAAGFGATNILEPINVDGFSFAKAPAAVPLPASGLLLIAGLGGAGLIGRRRRSA